MSGCSTTLAFLQAIENTFYVLLTVPALALLGLFLALALNSNTRLATILRSLFFSLFLFSPSPL